MVGGVLHTGRVAALIEEELPEDLETPEATAAWMSYVLDLHRKELKPLPDWMLLGQRNWDLIPWVRAQRQRERLYEARPRCYINRDYARVFRRHLLRTIAELKKRALCR